MFEQAIRRKYRFNLNGKLNVEELWDLDIDDLDTIYRNLKNDLKEATEDSLLSKKSSADKLLDKKIAIVTYIVNTKIAEQEVRLNAKENKAKKEELLGILREKQTEGMKNMSEEELKKMIDEL